jgi:predicted kinase
MKIIVLKGLPASGKTTYGKKLIEQSGSKHGGPRTMVRISRDDLRESMFNYIMDQKHEKIIRELRDYMIVSALKKGYDVVIDETNLNPKNLPGYKQLVKDAGFENDVEFEEKFFDKSLKQCIADDLKRPRSVGAKVITRFYEQYFTIKPLPYVADTTKLKAIIVDIDGTLAHMTGRKPHEYHRVFEDALDPIVASVVQRYKDDGYIIVLLSGRNDGCEDVTRSWLDANQVPYDSLLMRKEGDNRDDAIVKREIFDEHVRYAYNVEFVLDDRDRVVRMWRANGLKVLQVADGDF